MPIRFRCPHCNSLLGIATRKGGTRINCPQCGHPINVPTPAGPEESNNRLDLGDLDSLINPAGRSSGSTNGELHQFPSLVDDPAPAPARQVATAPPKPAPKPAPQPAAKPQPKPRPVRKPGEEAPLFEEDVDAILGVTTSKLDLDDAPAGPKPVSGLDAMSIDDAADRTLVLSSQKVTLLVVAVVLLLGLAFTAGFLIARSI